MQKRRRGASDWEITPIGVGAAEFRLGADEIAEIERFRAANAIPVTA